MPEMVEIYEQALLQEIDFWARNLGSRQIESIYLGGGTPSLCSLSFLKQVLEKIHHYFKVPSPIEFTLEANPESCKKEQVKGWYQLGVNRVSLGIQSFTEENLKLLGRIHSLKESRKAYYLLRQTGFKNINFDLMFGLPGQSVGKWLEEVKMGVSLRPEHFSCYGFTLEPGTYFAEKEKDYLWPLEEEVAKMYLYGAEYLESAGYLQYEISNYARMGYNAQHNVGYWEGADFLGLGPSAVSTIGQKRWQNPPNIKQYALEVEQGFKGLKVERIEGIKEVNEMVMLSLRTCKGLSLKKFRQKTGLNFTQIFQKSLEVLYNKGLISFRKGYVRLTRPGLLLSDSIIPQFFLEEGLCPDGDKS